MRELVGTVCALGKTSCCQSLAKNGIYVREIAELSAKRTAWANRYFQQEVFLMLTPLAVDASHPFPHLLNRSHNLLMRAKNAPSRRAAARHCRSSAASCAAAYSPASGHRCERGVEYIYLASLIKQHIGESRLDPGRRARVSRHPQQRSLH